jgi:hypothetical protein
VPYVAQRLARPAVLGVKGQDVGQVGHRLLKAVDDKGALEPRCLVVRIELQDGGEVTPGAGPLSGLGGLDAAVHERLELLA